VPVRDAATGPIYTLGEEVLHALTHGVGLVLSIAGLVALVTAASLRGSTGHIVGCAVFGATLVLMYTASTLYHGVRSPRAKSVLQRMDHAAIFLLIAGTYTPFTLVNLRGGWGWALLAVVWALAALGVTLQVLPTRARRFSMLLYLGMGWLMLIAIGPLMRTLQPTGLMLLLAGGAAYMLGVLFYAWRRLPYNHAVWHVFVMAGSVCHFSCVLGYVVPPAV